MMTSEQKKHSTFQEVFFIMLAFVLWMIMFRGYLLGRVALFDDAISYYDHIKFFLDNMRRGVFPLWDPLWFCGAANNFFLQRMGMFNPFLMLTNIFHAVGIPYTTAYLLYLVSYYFLGCLGFYVLAKRVLNEQLCAYAAFLLLLFSALGTRLFDSYLILMFTPIAWFFYFLVDFSSQPRRHSFVGIVFTLVIIGTTYIPFYFLLVLASFLFFYAVVYGNTVPELLRRYARFAIQNKILVVLCIVILLASMIPGVLFFKGSGGKGEFVMPARNTDQAVGSVLGVQRQDSTNSWSILEEIFFARYFYTDMTQIKFAVLYVPFWAGIIFFLGFLTRANKRVMFLFLWAVGLFLLCVPAASPVYGFFYKHVVLFKYFRNLHFLLWVALLPILCLFIAGQLKSFLSWQARSWSQKWAGFFYLSLVHGGLGWFIHWSQFSLVSSYFVLILSYAFFLTWLFGSLRKSAGTTLALLLVIIAIEPFEVYTWLSQNTKRYVPYAYSYDYTDLEFQYTRFDNDIDLAHFDDAPKEPPHPDQIPGKRFVQPGASIYYASKWYTYLAGNIDYDILRKYRKHRFILYDEVEHLAEDGMNFLTFETSLAENRNKAFVSSDDPEVLAAQSQGRHSYYAQPLEGDSDSFRVVRYNVNQIKVKTDFTQPKFLVYNDSYHTQWRVRIDGRPVKLVRANIAFKGVWVPAGRHTVEFAFGAWHLWWIYRILFILIYGLFVVLLIAWWRQSRRDEAGS